MRETKQFPFEIASVDGEGRTVEGYAAAFGNVDAVNDIIHPGAFAKTIAERGNQVKLLWQHQQGEPLGRVMALREDPRGLFIKAVISDTARGRDALALLKDGAIGEMSIGYDPVVFDYSQQDSKNIRNLREIKLHEISLVSFPANAQAQVTSLKATGPSEGKPWNVFRRGEEFCVFKLDTDGRATGDTLGCHPTEDEAMAQMRALYVHVPEAGKDGKKTQENKSVDLDKWPTTIRRAFDAQFNLQPSGGIVNWETNAWAKQIFDDHLIAEWKNDLYQVNYRLDDAGHHVFTPQTEWIKGDMVFIAGAKVARARFEIKSGRVLAKRNAERLNKIRVLLKELEDDAGIESNAEAEAGPEDGTPQGVTPPPTSTAKMLEIKEAELDMMIMEARNGLQG